MRATLNTYAESVSIYRKIEEYSLNLKSEAFVVQKQSGHASSSLTMSREMLKALKEEIERVLRDFPEL